MGDNARTARLDLKFLGDISLGGPVRELIERHGLDYPFELVRPALRNADVVVGNLECCLLDRADIEVAPKPRMTGLAEHVATLSRAEIDAVSLANNHAMDAGALGLYTARTRLDAAGITHFGASAERESAFRPALVTRRGRRIAFLGACEHSRGWAGPRRAGVAPLDWHHLGATVRELRPEADLIVAVLHADFEFTPCPGPARIRMSRWLVDQGADLVIQHHPHVWQGVERYGGGLIAYSLGNFVFPVHGNPYLDTQPGTTTSGVLSVSVTFAPDGGNAVDWHCTPVEIGPDHRPRLLAGEPAAAALREIDRRSTMLGDTASVRRHRFATCRRELRQALLDTCYTVRRGRWRHAVGPTLDLLRRPDQRRSITGFLSGGRI